MSGVYPKSLVGTKRGIYYEVDKFTKIDWLAGDPYWHYIEGYSPGHYGYVYFASVYELNVEEIAGKTRSEVATDINRRIRDILIKCFADPPAIIWKTTDVVPKELHRYLD